MVLLDSMKIMHSINKNEQICKKFRHRDLNPGLTLTVMLSTSLSTAHSGCLDHNVRTNY
jgi:hypothetical protein